MSALWPFEGLFQAFCPLSPLLERTRQSGNASRRDQIVVVKGYKVRMKGYPDVLGILTESLQIDEALRSFVVTVSSILP